MRDNDLDSGKDWFGSKRIFHTDVWVVRGYSHGRSRSAATPTISGGQVAALHQRAEVPENILGNEVGWSVYLSISHMPGKRSASWKRGASNIIF